MTSHTHSDSDCILQIGYTTYSSKVYYQEVVLEELLRRFYPLCSECGYDKVMYEWTEFCADCYWDDHARRKAECRQRWYELCKTKEESCH